MTDIREYTASAPAYPAGKHAAVVISIDDVRPGISVDQVGDGNGPQAPILSAIAGLRKNQSQLVVTLFTVPDCREKNPFPTRRLLSHVPLLNRYFYLSPIWTGPTLSLEKHPEFCRQLGTLPGMEIAVHGLHHVSKGQPVYQEFRWLSLKECLRRLESAEGIFERVGLHYVKGFSPPGWDASPALLRALQVRKYQFLAASRDLETPITADAVTNSSGLRHLSLLYPSMIPGTDIVHIPANWSRTSTFERADRILELGGVLSIKGHAIKQEYGYTAVDGIDKTYCDYLERLFSHIKERWGGNVWWTTMGELASQYRRTIKEMD